MQKTIQKQKAATALLLTIFGCVGIGLLSGGCGTTSEQIAKSSRTADPETAEFTTSTGEKVVVPLKGKLASETTTALAAEIKETDSKIDALELRGRTPTAVERAMLQIARDEREEAVHELSLAYQVAAQTSSGIADVKKSKDLIAIARRVVGSQPPAQLRVSTNIQVSDAPNVVVRYTLSRKRDSGDWRGYTDGDLLDIGLYVFRCEGGNLTVPYEEKVLVLDDPTRQTLRPTPAQPGSPR